MQHGRIVVAFDVSRPSKFAFEKALQKSEQILGCQPVCVKTEVVFGSVCVKRFGDTPCHDSLFVPKNPNNFPARSGLCKHNCCVIRGRRRRRVQREVDGNTAKP